MPEASDFMPWYKGKWDNVGDHSGTRLEKRPYYYKISEEGSKILIISAVERQGCLHATDFLQLDRRSFEQLKGIVNSVFGI